MRFRTVLLLVIATLMGFVIFAEASSSGSSSDLKSSEEKIIKEKELKAIEHANSQTNPLEALNKPQTFVSNDGYDMTIECIKGKSLSGELLKWYKSLLDKDSELVKDKLASCGYDAEERHSTYLIDTTYLLIVRSSSKKPVGFTHFRFEMDPTDTIGIVYLWDILVEESMRGRGIGTYLLDTVMNIATHFKMRKTFLTVFKSNTRAIKLYTQCGFTVDKSLPEEDLYIILSRPTN